MKPGDLVLRCYAIERGEKWSAFCVDLSLAAQGDSFDQARHKLEVQIAEYVTDAMTIDKEHAEYLLTRKAPMSQRLMWHWLRACSVFHALKRMGARLFSEPMPLVPAPASC
jgi:hypothetical protein